MISKYDSLISSYLDRTENKSNILMNNTVSIDGGEIAQLRYGENPHQKAKLYQVKRPNLTKFDYEQLSGKELSFNNLVDTESAFSCVEQFSEPSCVIVKHANPCGGERNKPEQGIRGRI